MRCFLPSVGSDGGVAAVEDDGGAVEIAGIGPGQERDCPRDVGRFADLALRDALEDLRAEVWLFEPPAVIGVSIIPG
jgi:hypothetical protein